MKEMRLEFRPDDKIDDQCYELVQQVFGIESALLTNESMLDDFDDKDIPGHELVRLSLIPASEKSHYERVVRITPDDRILVWYPPVTKEEEAKINKETRERLLKQVEAAYGISIADYPEDAELYIWKVVEFIKRKKSQNGTMA